VLASGRLSARDEKEPQIVLDALRPIDGTAQQAPPAGGACGGMANGGNAQCAGGSPQNGGEGRGAGERTLFVKLASEKSPEYERLRLVHMMFPGRERMVIHFSETKKNVSAKCVVHEALVAELRGMLGDENVVVTE